MLRKKKAWYVALMFERQNLIVDQKERIREKTNILSWEKKKMKVCYACEAFILGFTNEITDAQLNIIIFK